MQNKKKQNTLQFYIEKYGLIQGYIKYKNKNKKCKIDYTEKTYLKTLDSMVKNGRWISKELKKYKDLYYEIVKRETKKSLRKYKIKNFELVGDISKDRDNYHIDHKFSVSEGLKNNILPQIIGSIVNLECINGIENIKKQNKCSLTKKELFKRK